MKYTQIKNKIILASKSKVRKKILEENGINCYVEPANIDGDLVKESLFSSFSENLVSSALIDNLIGSCIDVFILFIDFHLSS